MPGWGKLADGSYCSCRYGQTLKAAWQAVDEQERLSWLRDVRAGSKLPPRYATANLADFPPGVQLGAQLNVAQGKGLFLWGPVGTGKTHLAAALLNSELDAGRPGYFLVVPEWLESLRQSFGTTEGPKPLLARAMETRLLVLDDIGVERPTEWVCEQLYNLVNTRYLESRALVITSNRSLAELEQRIGDRTCSRIAELCASVHLGGADRRVRR